MSYADLHTHTTFSDGKYAPEQMIEAAIARGFEKIGISDHAYTAFDTRYCMKEADIPRYHATLQALKEAYQGRIEVLCGIEQDLYATYPPTGYDYVIGSVHYLHMEDAYIPVDESAQDLLAAADRYCGGDTLRLVELYFASVIEVAKVWKPDIIGHFDVIRKYNRDNAIYDEAHPRARAAAQAALDALLPLGIPFEINTGGIYRGCRDDAYPAPEWIDYIRSHGGRLILAGDCHKTEQLGFQFDRYAPFTR